MALLLATLLAAAAPPLELADAGGAVHRLADYRGKVVLVNFWATWCEPCLAELPTIEKLRASFAGRPFAALAVQMAGSARMSRDTAEKLSLRFPMLVDRDSAASKAWGVKVVPTSFLIGPDGSVAFTLQGELDWSDAVARRRVRGLLPR
jgi:peroxiredoxin